MRFDLDDLSLPLEAPNPDGLPLQIDVDSIDEDPEQPRQAFDDESLQQLAASIAEHGVLQAISVRRHPEQPGRWLLNFGARRLRACRHIGRAQVPAFINETPGSYDQIVENEQRDGMKPLELALFVQKRLAAGESQAEIARLMGKSRAYVTHATALIEAPDWLVAVYREKRCIGLSDLYELRRLHGEHPQYVEAWASDRQAISREMIRALSTELNDERSARAGTSQVMAVAQRRLTADRRNTADVRQFPSKPAKADAPTMALRAVLDDVRVNLIVDRVPDEAGHVFVMMPNDRAVRPVEAHRLRLVGFEKAECLGQC